MCVSVYVSLSLTRSEERNEKIYVCSCVCTEEICSRGGRERRQSTSLTPAVANDTHLAI